MANTGIDIQLKADTTQLDAGIKRAERDARSASKAFRELDKAAQSLSGADLDFAIGQKAEQSIKKYTASFKELQLVQERMRGLESKNGGTQTKKYSDLTKKVAILKSTLAETAQQMQGTFSAMSTQAAQAAIDKLRDSHAALTSQLEVNEQKLDAASHFEETITKLKELYVEYEEVAKAQDELNNTGWIQYDDAGNEINDYTSRLEELKNKKLELASEAEKMAGVKPEDYTSIAGLEDAGKENIESLKKSIIEIRQEVAATEGSLKDVDSVLERAMNPQPVRDLDREIEEATTSYRELSSAAESLDGDDKVRATEAAFEQLQQAIDLTKEKINQLEGELSTMDSSSPEFAAKQKELFSAKGSLANLEGALDPKPVSRYSGVLGKMSEGLQSMGLSANAADVAMGNLASKGMQLAAEAARAIVRAFTEAIKLTAEFDHTMSAVQAFSGGSAADLKELEATALELGATTRYTANQVADSMTILAKAGWKNEDITAGMKGILDTTTASGESIETVSAAIVQSLNAFGASAEESSKYGDVLTKSALSAYLSIEEIAESMKYVGPVAKTFGSDIAEVNTILVALAKNGIAGGQAGTMMRSFMLRLANDTNNARSTIESLGVEVMDSFGNFNSITSIIDQLRAKVSGLSAAEQARIAKVAAGERGSSGLLALLNMEQKEYDALYDSIEDSIGSTSDAAEKMQDNLQGDFEILKSRVQDLGIDIGHALDPALRGLTQFATGFIDLVDTPFNKFETKIDLVEDFNKEFERTEKLLEKQKEIRFAFQDITLSDKFEDTFDKITELQAYSGRSLTIEGQEELTGVLDDLISKYPVLSTLIDAQTGLIDTQKASYDSLLSSVREYIELQAREQLLIDTKKQSINLQAQLDNSKKQLEVYERIDKIAEGINKNDPYSVLMQLGQIKLDDKDLGLEFGSRIAEDISKSNSLIKVGFGAVVDSTRQYSDEEGKALLEFVQQFYDGFDYLSDMPIQDALNVLKRSPQLTKSLYYSYDRAGNESAKSFIKGLSDVLEDSGKQKELGEQLLNFGETGNISSLVKWGQEQGLDAGEDFWLKFTNALSFGADGVSVFDNLVGDLQEGTKEARDAVNKSISDLQSSLNESQDLETQLELDIDISKAKQELKIKSIALSQAMIDEWKKRREGDLSEYQEEIQKAYEAVLDPNNNIEEQTVDVGGRTITITKQVAEFYNQLIDSNTAASKAQEGYNEQLEKAKDAATDLDDALKTVNDNFSREQGAKEWAKGIGDALDEVDQKVEDYKKNIESNWQSFEYGGGEFKENKYGEDNYVTIEKNIENFTKRNDKMEKMLNYYNDGKLADMMAKGQDLLVQQIVKAIEAGDFDALEEIYENQTNTLNMQGEEYAEKMESTLEEQYERQKKLAELAARLAIQFSQEDLSSVLSSNLSVDQAENYKNQIETIATNLKEGIGELGSQTLDEGQLNQAYAWIDAMQRLGLDLSDATKALLENTELQASDPGEWLRQLLTSLSTDYTVGIDELRNTIAEHTDELAPEIQEQLNSLLDPKNLSVENAEKAKDLLISSLDNLYNIVEGENGELTFTPKMVVDGITPDPEAPQKGTEAAESAKTDVQDAIDNNPKEVDTELKNNVTVNDGDVEDNTGDNTAVDVTKIVNVKEAPIISNKDAVDEKVKEAAGNSVKVDKTVELYLKPLVRSTGSVDSTAAMKASETVKTTKTVNQDVEKNVTVNTSIKTNITGDKGNEVGSKFGREIASGIQSQAGAISGAASSVMNGAAASAGAMSAAGYNAGSNWSAGMLAGILSREGQIAAAATRIANTVKNATAAAHDSHSPSRVAEQYGIWWDQGLAIGLDKGTQDVIAANDRVTKALIDATSSADASYTAAQAFASGFANSLSTELEKEISKNKQSAIDSITTSFESNKDSKERAKAALKHSSTVKRGSKEFDDAVKKEADDWEKLASEKQKAIDKKQTELDKKGKKKAKGKKKKKLQNEIKELEKEQQVYLNNAYIAAQEEARIQAERDRIDSKLDLVDTNATLRENKLIEQNSGKELTMQQKLQLASEKRAEAQRVLNEVNANDAATTEQKIDAYNKYIDAVKGATEAEQERLETLIGMASANAASTKTSLTISHKGGPLAAAEELLVAQNQVKKALEAQNVVNKSTYATDELRQKAADETAKAYTEQYNAIRKVNQEIIESAGKKIEKWRIETEYAQKSALRGSQQIQKAQLELNALQESYQKLLKQSNATEEEKLEMMDKITQATEALHGSYRDLYKDMLGGMSIDKPFTAAEVRINETIENMESHITGLTDLMEARAAVVERGLSDLALSYLNSLSPEEAANYYIELQNASDQEFNKFNKTLTELALKNKEYSDIQQQTEDVIADRVTNIAQTLYNISTAGIPINAYTAGLNNAGVSLQSSINTSAIEQGMSSIITALMGMSKKFDDASGELVSSLDDFSRDITTAFGKVGISIDGREFGRIIRQYV